MIRIATAFCLLTALAGPSAYASFEAGVEAYAAKDYARALDEWRESADDGDAVAQWLVGNMCLNGEGLPAPDAAAAAAYYRKAADQGHAEAQVSLATLLRLGQGVPQDYAEAIAWLYKAAAQRHPVAQTDLGELFLTGEAGKVEAVPEHAIYWYRLAAKQGVVLAQFKAAQIYLEGVGTPADPELGFAWLALANKTAGENLDSDLSKRVMPLTRVVETDSYRRTLGQIIQDTYLRYRESLPADVVREAEERAASYDPSQF